MMRRRGLLNKVGAYHWGDLEQIADELMHGDWDTADDDGGASRRAGNADNATADRYSVRDDQ